MICAKCNIENEDTNKFCIDCGEKLISDSFWKHLFNWKYYIFPFFLSLIIGGSIKQTNDIYTIYEIGLSLLLIAIIYHTYTYKSSFFKKTLMFFTVFICTVLVYSLTLKVIIGEELISKILEVNLEPRKTNEAIINDLLSSNKKLPIMLTGEIKYEAITSNDKKSVTQHLKFINYTKEAILSEYQQNIDTFEKDILMNELKSSCSTENIKKILSNGLIFNQIYYDKNNQIIGQIYLDNNRCEPYYKIIQK